MQVDDKTKLLREACERILEECADELGQHQTYTQGVHDALCVIESMIEKLETSVNDIKAHSEVVGYYTDL